MTTSFKYLRPLIILFLAGLLLTLGTCKKEVAIRSFPRTLTGKVTDISKNGIRFHGDILALGSEPVLDHGFVIDKSGKPSLRFGEVISLGPADRTGPFEAYVTLALEDSVTYYVRSFLKTKNFLVYGQLRSFVAQGSNPPVITGFSPKTGTWGDTLQISGQLFGNQLSDNKVFFDTTEARIFRASDTSLTVTVPPMLVKKESIISVVTFGRKSQSHDHFLLHEPVINKIEPDHGFYKDTIDIYGAYFSSSYTKVFIDSISAGITDISSDHIRVLVPGNLKEGYLSVRVSVNDMSAEKQDAFYSSSPVFSSLTPEKGTFRDTLTLRGKNFHPERPKRRVTMDNISCPVISFTDTLIRFTIPDATPNEIPEIKVFIDDLPFSTGNKFKGLYLPDITDISPDTVFFNSYFWIRGHYFNPVPSRNKVTIAGVGAPVASNSTTERLVVLFPTNINVPDGKAAVKLTIGNMTTSGTQEIIIPAPVIYTVSPDSGIAGEKIYITGDNFNHYWGNNSATLESQENVIPATINVESRTSAYLQLPEMTPLSPNLFIKVAGQKSKPFPYELARIKITDVSPRNLTKGCTITISGNNFHVEFSNTTNQLNKVFLSILSDPIRLTSATHTTMTLTLPDIDHASGPVTLRYQLGVQEIILTDSLYYSNPWNPYTTLNIDQAEGYSTCMDGADVYMGVGTVGEDSSFWRYNVTNNSLTRLPDYPAKGFGSTSFFLNGKAYVCAPTFDSIRFPSGTAFFAFDPVTSSWQQLDPPSGLHYRTISFTMNGKAYVGLGHLGFTGFRDWFEYDPASNSWTRKEDFPGTLPNPFTPASFVIDNLGYILSNNGELWTYDPANDTWTQKSSVPYQVRSEMTAFSFGKTGYAGLGANSGGPMADFWEYDQATDTWNKTASAPVALSGAFSFSYNGKGYVGGGLLPDRSYNKVLYEFDLSQ